MLFLRFQATPELESESAHDDIIACGIRLENGEDRDELMTIYGETFSLRNRISAEELMDLVASANGSLSQLQSLTDKHLLTGVCCYQAEMDSQPDDFYDGVSASGDFAVLFEGDLIGDCGDGVIAHPKKLINVWDLR